MAKANKSPITPQILLVITVVLLVGGIIGYYIGNSFKESTKLTDTTADESSSSILDITELGVKLNILELPTLAYKYSINSSGDETAILYTPELAVYCSPDSSSAGLGVILKINGQYVDVELPKPGDLIKQYDTYFISYQTPQQQCTVDEKGLEIATEQLPKVEKIINSVQ